jgi:hypothetical protein
MTIEQVRELSMKIIKELNIYSAMSYSELREASENYKKLFDTHSGATKMCITLNNEPYVIKWKKQQFSFWSDEIIETETDEAYEEYLIYQDAVKKHLECFFPYTEVLAEINGIIFILQEKIDYSDANLPMELIKKYSKVTSTVTFKIYDKMCNDFYIKDRDYNRALSKRWAGMVISLYGKHTAKQLAEFVREHKINDLHDSNIGYKNNKPIILDFSGYNRDE